MATNVGKNAKITIGGITVVSMASWTLNDTQEVIRGPVFGDDYDRVHGIGVQTVGGSVEGFLDITGAGQDQLHGLVVSGTKTTTFKVYEDATNFWGTDTSADATAGVYISNLNITEGTNEVASVSFDWESDGAFVRNPS